MHRQFSATIHNACEMDLGRAVVDVLVAVGAGGDVRGRAS